jgi:hypothetical protein
MEQPEKRRSPWLYVGLGCGALVLLVVVGVVVSGLWLATKVKDVAAEMNDPVVREAKVKSALGAKDLPAGYYPQMSFSLPMLMDMAILSDRPPDPAKAGPGDGIDKRGFLYFKFPSKGQDQQQLRDYFSGTTDDATVLKRNNINVDAKEIIRRGTFDSNGHPVLYLSQRGAARNQMGGGQLSHDGLNTMVLFQCSGNDKLRMGIWIGEDPQPDKPVKEADFAGTVADEAELRPFIAHFHPCEA